MEEIQSAKYNGGVLGIIRIDKILAHLNFTKENPLAFDSERQEYNYKLWFREVCNLMDEYGSLFNDTELKTCIAARKIIDGYIEKFEVYMKPNSKKIDSDAWTKIKKGMEIFEREIKRLGYKYEVLTAYKEQAGRI
jgi:hypothetical protein